MERNNSNYLKKYIPIIDLETDFFYLCDDPPDEEKRNAWEQYFYQVSDYSVKSTLTAKNVLLSDGNYSDCGILFFDDTKISFSSLKPWYIVDEENMKLLPFLEKRFQETAERLISDKKVLGVMVRDGYSSNKDLNIDIIKNHPKQPTMDYFIKKINNYLARHKDYYLFVVAESYEAVDYLKNQYNDKIIVTNRPRKRYADLAYQEDKSKYLQGYSMRQNNFDYLEEIYILSKCNALIAGKCSGSIVAALWNRGNYEDMEIFQLGLY